MSDIELTPVDLIEIEGAAEIRQEYASLEILDYAPLIKEVQQTGVALSEDPSSSGLHVLNAQIAKIDAQKTRVASILSKAIENEDALQSLHKKILGVYKREFDSHLPESPVRDFPNAASREAACNTLLKNLKELVNDIEGSLSNAKTFSKVVTNELNKLDSTNKNISRQITVIQHQLELGEIQRQGTFNKSSEGLHATYRPEDAEGSKDEKANVEEEEDEFF